MSHALASPLDDVGSAGSDLTCAGFCRFYNYLNSNPFTLIRRVAAVSKNGLLLTNPRVVLASGAHLNTAPLSWAWKGPRTTIFRKIGMVLAMGARNAGMGRAGSFANYGVSAIAIRAWLAKFIQEELFTLDDEAVPGAPPLVPFSGFRVER